MRGGKVRGAALESAIVGAASEESVTAARSRSGGLALGGCGRGCRFSPEPRRHAESRRGKGRGGTTDKMKPRGRKFAEGGEESV